MFNDDDMNAPTDGGAVTDMPSGDETEEKSSGEETGNSGM